jgi:hypothetical protein
MTTLYRAVAYRLQRHDTPLEHQQPECHVFVEAADHTAAAATLLRTLAAAWACEPADVEFYNLYSEAELRSDASTSDCALGDAALLLTGWYHGPLFCRADRVLALVQPRTLARLTFARHLTEPWQRRQRHAARMATATPADLATARAQMVRQMVQADTRAH